MRIKILIFSLGIILFALMIFILHMARYSISTVAATGETAPRAYLLDRWTGTVTYFVGQKFYETKDSHKLPTFVKE